MFLFVSAGENIYEGGRREMQNGRQGRGRREDWGRLRYLDGILYT